ncbi:MAG: hypothetical protein CME26_04945 [Gemmatimonadetes bacterium]|nr:hypothetical protein [Gemmatimonadota bacterium]
MKRVWAIFGAFGVLFCAQLTAAVPFEPLRQYETGYASTGIYAGDLDGDGDVDLAVSNRGTSDITILYNNGLSLFPTSDAFGTGEGPRYVDGGDFDGDGDIDLYTPDYHGLTTTILRNNGDGTFEPWHAYLMGKPAFLWTDDLDGDGYEDIIVLDWDIDSDPPSQNPAKFVPLFNDGEGNFTPGDHAMIGVQPRGGASADLNGDGIKDAITANLASNSFSVVLGLGKRQWADGIEIQVNGGPRYVTLGDFDDDGDIDFVGIDKTYSKLWVFHNDGSANFSQVATSSTSNNPHSIANADMDGDGDLDLVVTHVSSAQSLVYFNNGQGLFPTTQVVYMYTGPAEVKIADVNGDGDLDIVSANVNLATKGASVVLQGTCDGFDCNQNGIGDECDLPDCNWNLVPDECDIEAGDSIDLDGNGVPDECQDDCNENDVPDSLDIALGTSEDCNGNDIPDECDWDDPGDCDGDGIVDGCEADENNDSLPDDCQCIEDLDGSAEVDVLDLLIIISEWGPSHSPADLNYDGIVDVLDLLLILDAWGECDAFIPNIRGACCLDNGNCTYVYEIICGINDGDYMGDYVPCDKVECD